MTLSKDGFRSFPFLVSAKEPGKKNAIVILGKKDTDWVVLPILDFEASGATILGVSTERIKDVSTIAGMLSIPGLSVFFLTNRFKKSNQ